MKRWTGVTVGVLAAVALAAAAALVLTWRPVIPGIAPPPPGSFAPDAVRRGAALAAIGDCVVCHTAPGGRPYAGARAIATPFGSVYSADITPAPRTGIGRWSEAAFVRAMRKGVSRDGSHLYPAFPYTHFNGATDGDLRDLYAFLMTRTPVEAARPDNQLAFPLGFRPLLAGWNLPFLKRERLGPEPGRSAAWNRGRYLAETLAHCGACHTPRNALGAEKRDHAYAGGWSDGWYAPALNAASPAVRAWTEERLFTYLRTGLGPDHAAAAGPMGPVTRGLSQAPESDVRAIAAYFAARMADAPAARREPPAPDREQAAGQAHPQGAAIFAGACAVCHGAGAPMMLEGRPPLPLGTPLNEASPRDTVQIVLKGLTPPVGRAGPYMPAFGDSLNDGQLAELAAYLRARFTDKPPWGGDLEGEVSKARREGAPS